MITKKKGRNMIKDEKILFPLIENTFHVEPYRTKRCFGFWDPRFHHLYVVLNALMFANASNDILV